MPKGLTFEVWLLGEDVSAGENEKGKGFKGPGGSGRPSDFKSPHGWELLTGDRATLNVIRVDSDLSSLKRAPSELFQHALLWDAGGFQLQIPDEVKHEFKTFQEASSTVGDVRQKLVNGGVAFEKCFVETSGSVASPSEILMRMTF